MFLIRNVTTKCNVHGYNHLVVYANRTVCTYVCTAKILSEFLIMGILSVNTKGQRTCSIALPLIAAF